MYTWVICVILQVYLRGPRAGVHNNVVVMSEQIRQLEVELEAQAKELKYVIDWNIHKVFILNRT